MTENDKLRALLAEARAEIRGRLGHTYDCEGLCSTHQLLSDIDAALAEPVESLSVLGIILDSQRNALAASVLRLERERDEARAYAEERNGEANKLQRYLNMAAAERDEARAEVKALCEAAEDLMSSMGCGCCGSASFHDDAATLRDAIEKAEKAMKVKP